MIKELKLNKTMKLFPYRSCKLAIKCVSYLIANTKKIIISVSVILFLLMGFGVFYNPILPQFIVSEALYASVSTDSLMRESELVFVGKVTSVSETQWNQDNGRFLPEATLGKLYLGQFPKSETIQSRLQWGMSELVDYTMQMQCEQTPDGTGQCFSLAPDGRVYSNTAVTNRITYEDNISVGEGSCSFVN